MPDTRGIPALLSTRIGHTPHSRDAFHPHPPREGGRAYPSTGSGRTDRQGRVQRGFPSRHRRVASGDWRGPGGVPQRGPHGRAGGKTMFRAARKGRPSTGLPRACRRAHGERNNHDSSTRYTNLGISADLPQFRDSNPPRGACHILTIGIAVPLHAETLFRGHNDLPHGYPHHPAQQDNP